MVQLAPEAWFQQGEEFQQSAVLVKFPCVQNKTTIEKFCARALPCFLLGHVQGRQ